MIQSAHSHLRRLGAEKSQLEEEAKRTHEMLRQKFLHLTTQCKLLFFLLPPPTPIPLYITLPRVKDVLISQVTVRILPVFITIER